MLTQKASISTGIMLGICIVCGLAVVVGVFYFVVEQARARTMRSESRNNLKQIGLALQQYAESQGHFPAGTSSDKKLNNPEERLSWLVEILPELGQHELHESIEQVRSGVSTKIVYQLNGEPKDAATIARCIEVMRRRVDPEGTKNLTLRHIGKNQIEVNFPLETREMVQQYKLALTALGTLEFCVLANSKNPDHQVLIAKAKKIQGDILDGKNLIAGWREITPEVTREDGNFVEILQTRLENARDITTRQIAGQAPGCCEVLCIFEPTADRRVTGKYLVQATPERDQAGNPSISFTLTPSGGTRLGILTAKYSPGIDGTEYHMAMLLDDKVQTAAVIRSPIHSNGQITGKFTYDDVARITNILNAGAMEMSLKKQPVSEVTIDLAATKDLQFGHDDYKGAFQQELKVVRNPNLTRKPLPGGYAATNYVGIAGVGEDAATLKIRDPRAGIFGYDRRTRFSDIKDGMSNTLLVGEVYRDLGPWAQGGHATVRGLTTKPYINGPDGIGCGKGSGGVNVLMADGSVRFVSENIASEVFEAMATMAGGETVGEF
jgi:prepilin-type processing-associated H-X9-DG protein